MPVQGIVVTKFPDPRWGFPVVARVLPREGNPWGVLAFLQGTSWEGLFPLVGDDVLDMALRGHATPLMRVLGPPPVALARRLPVVDGLCNQHGDCLMAAEHCHPGPRVPDCWVPPNVDPNDAPVLSYVVQLWREGTLVILIQPKV